MLQMLWLVCAVSSLLRCAVCDQSTCRAEEGSCQDSFDEALTVLFPDGKMPALHTVAARAAISSLNGDAPNGGTLLHYAAAVSDINVMKVLLDHPLFVSADDVDSQGATALHIATGRGHVEATRGLLEHSKFTAGDVVDKHGASALYVAAGRGHADVAQALLDNPRFSAADAADKNGATALHMATWPGHAQTAKVLLDHAKFSAVEAVTLEGNSGLRMAALEGHAEIVDMFLGHPKWVAASVMAKRSDVAAALDGATTREHAGIVQVLNTFLTSIDA